MREAKAKNNRSGHFPIDVTREELKKVDICPCCKAGNIEEKSGAMVAQCTNCKQIYIVKE